MSEETNIEATSEKEYTGSFLALNDHVYNKVNTNTTERSTEHSKLESSGKKDYVNLSVLPDAQITPNKADSSFKPAETATPDSRDYTGLYNLPDEHNYQKLARNFRFCRDKRRIMLLSTIVIVVLVAAIVAVAVTLTTNRYDRKSASSSLNSTVETPTTDTTAPTFIGSCNEIFFLDTMDNVNFTPGVPSDNFAVANFSQSSYIQPGDIITEDASLTYTADDFAGNSATCNVFFNVIDRNKKPALICPDFVTLLIAESATAAEYEVNGIPQSSSVSDKNVYRTSSHISVSGGTVTVVPTIISISTADVGTAQIVSASAENDYGTTSKCTFMVNYMANDCFEQELFTDDNALRTCYTQDSSDLICTSICNNAYLYRDGTNKKNFTCTGEGVWNLTTNPNDRYCLNTANVEYELPVSVIYTLNYFAKSCLTQFSEAINRDVPDFVSRISTLCSDLSWNVTVTKLDVTAQFSEFNVNFKLTLRTTSATIADRDACVAKIPNNQQIFDVDNRQLTCGANTYSLTAGFPTKGTPVQTCTQHTYTKISTSVLNGEICVSVGPGEFYDSISGSVMSCFVGQYQDELAQTSCKTCPSGKYPNAEKTSCKTTCPAGFTSADGFYPCKPCPVDEYWVNKTTCVACPLDSSTVGQEGVSSGSQCYAKCPAGFYSRTGYNIGGCIPCPLNFYQDIAGQIMCKECGFAEQTIEPSSTHIDNCTNILDACDTAYCLDRGTCDFAYHRRICRCNSGYYGDKCENQYHICDGKPCASGYTCRRGSGSTNYTCSRQ